MRPIFSRTLNENRWQKKAPHNKSESLTQVYRDFFLLCSCSDPLDRQIGNSERKDELSQAFRFVSGQASEYQPSEKFNPAAKQSADQVSLIKSGDFPLIVHHDRELVDSEGLAHS